MTTEQVKNSEDLERMKHYKSIMKKEIETHFEMMDDIIATLQKLQKDIETHFKMMDDIIATLQKLQHDSWDYLYYLNVVDKKMSKLKEGENHFPH